MHLKDLDLNVESHHQLQDALDVWPVKARVTLAFPVNFKVIIINGQFG